MLMRIQSAVVAVSLLFSVGAWASTTPETNSAQEHNEHEHSGHEHHHAEATVTPEAKADAVQADTDAGAAPGSRNLGLDEKLGNKVPLDLEFRDEEGRQVTLGSLLTVPTIVIPIFYHCGSSCPMEMESVAKLIPKMGLVPGKDYRILSVSFDPEDTPEDARASRKNYLKIAGEGFPPEAWHFLVGDAANVKRFLDAIGFRVQRNRPHDFSHPNGILTLSTEGKIARYLYGSVFLPFDVGLALEEASRGVTGLTARRLLTYCYTYDSTGNRYVVSVTKISAASTLSVALGFIFFLAFGKKKKRP